MEKILVNEVEQVARAKRIETHLTFLKAIRKVVEKRKTEGKKTIAVRIRCPEGWERVSHGYYASFCARTLIKEGYNVNIYRYDKNHVVLIFTL